MKRILSIIVCVVMIVGIMPATFATETSEDIVYNFTTEGAKIGNWTRENYFRIYSYAVHDGGTRIYPTAGYTAAGNNGQAYAITVPDGVNGTYKPVFTYAGIESGAIVNVYLVSKTDTDAQGWDLSFGKSTTTKAESAVLKAINNSKSENAVVKLIMQGVDTYNNQTANSAVATDFSETGSVYGENVKLSAGTYYLIFEEAGARTGAPFAANYNSYWYRPVSFTFEKQATEQEGYNYVFSTSARTEGENFSLTDGGLGYNMVEGASEPWDYMAVRGTSSAICKDGEEATRFSVKAASGDKIGNNALIYKIKFAEKGKYVPTLYYQPYANGGKVAVYLIPAIWMEAQNKFEGKLDTGDEALSVLGVAKNNNKLIGEANTYSDATKVSASVVGYTTFAETEITEDEYYLVFSMNGAQGSPASNGSYYAYLSSLSFKKVGEVENVEAPTVALAVAYGDENPTVTSYPRGKEITLTAPDKTDENLTFRHWVRGTADGGDWITNDATYSFTLATNTYLTAVYTDTAAETDKIAEFWGGNGEYITEKKADANGKVAFPENPKLTGFEFLQWIIAKNTPVTADTVFENAVTRVVADFVDDADVTFEVDGMNYVYDTKVHKDADAEKAWYRDDVLVGYGKTYDYHVWDAVGKIEARDISGEKLPVVVLDDTVKEEQACMIEYDAAGKDVTEVGIVFGTSSATIDSCNSKATSQKKLSHGQFTAKPNKNGNASYARGYIIYNDAGVYRVTYTEPVALNS